VSIGYALILTVDEQSSDGFEARQLLLVATCHIHWDPDYSDVKLIQTMMLMNELKNITEDVISTSVDGDAGPPKAIPLMLCGDFNSLPDSGMRFAPVFSCLV
jgi:CCR4-NOT transcription complex subunit 6